jgi:hypothetical protein
VPIAQAGGANELASTFWDIFSVVPVGLSMSSKSSTRSWFKLNRRIIETGGNNETSSMHWDVSSVVHAWPGDATTTEVARRRTFMRKKRYLTISFRSNDESILQLQNLKLWPSQAVPPEVV